MSYGYSIPDLDIDKLNQSEDPKIAISEVSNLIQQDSNYKIWAARQWMESFYQYAGLRDIGMRAGTGTVSSDGRSIQQGNLSTGLGGVGRRRTPKVFKAIQIQAANITRRGPTIKCWPRDESEEANKQAKLSNITLDFLWEKDEEDEIHHEAVLWALMTPLVSRKDYLDYSYNRSRIWPKFKTDPETGLLLQDQPEMDPSGKPILEQLPWNKTDIIPAFRLIVGSTEGRLSDLDFVCDITYKRLAFMRDNYMKNAPGYYPENVRKLQKGAWNFTALMAYEMAIKQIGFGGNRYFKNGYGFSGLKDEVIDVSLFLKPTKEYPKGHEINIANGLLMYNGESRSYNEDMDIWHPHSFLTYEKVPGRPWGTTYAEKITQIATAYDQGRTEFDRLRRTFSVPKLLMPNGSQLERDTITGDEQILRYNAYAATADKPAYLNAPQPPNTIVEDIKLTAMDFTEGSGITEILQGRLPPNATTYRQTEILKEEANNAQAPFIRMNEAFIRNGQMRKLDNIRKCLIYPDKNLVQAIRIYKKMTNNVTDVEITNFTGDNLLAHVKIEKHSTIAKSKLALQEKYITLAQMGVLGDIVNDPDLNREFKLKMDVDGFDSMQNQQVSMAQYENDLMLQSEKLGQIINPPVYEWQDDAIHIRICEGILNDPTMQGQQLLIQSVLMHRKRHQDQQAMKMAKQLEIQAQMQSQQALTSKPSMGNNGSNGNPQNAPRRSEEGPAV